MRANLGDGGARQLTFDCAGFDERNEPRSRNFDDVDSDDARAQRTAVRTGADGCGRRDDPDTA